MTTSSGNCHNPLFSSLFIELWNTLCSATLSASCSNSQITSLQTFDQYLGPFLVKDICIINSLTFQVILIQLGHFWMPHPPFICSIDGVCHHCIKNVLFLLKANELNEKALPSLSRNYWNMTLQKVLNNNPNVFVKAF